MEKATGGQEHQFAILEAAPNGMCLLDAKGSITYVNTAFLTMSGYTREGLIGRHINDFSPLGAKDEVLIAGKQVVSYPIQLSGMTVTVDVTPLMENEQLTGAVVAIKEEAQVIALNEQLQIALAKVEYLEQRLKENKETGWHSSRMRSESPEEKMVRSIRPGKAFEKFIGMSQRVLDALTLAAKAAKVQSTVFICGKSGTGKEVVAEGIHQASPRSQGPFIRLNCAAIPATLLESELFGHEKGAFTGAIKKKLGKFELAHKGTIFLDEIGEMELNMQTKLLRVLQSSRFERVGGEETLQVDVRVLAATNQDMEQMVKEGRFREDLYYRLNVIPIYLPPLKERQEDIPLLVDHFLKKFSQEFNKPIAGIKKAAMDALVRYEWPGNVRELQNIVERMVALTDGLYIEKEDIPDCCLKTVDSGERDEDNPPFFGSLIKGELFPLAEYEKQIIKAALEKHGSYTAAGKVLGITHKTVAAKVQKYGIDRMEQ